MTWSQRPDSDHAMAAIGMVVGMVVIALFVAAVVILNASPAHAAVLDDRHGYREATGALILITVIFGGAALTLRITDTIRNAKNRRARRQP